MYSSKRKPIIYYTLIILFLIQSCTYDVYPIKVYEVDEVSVKWTAYKYVERFGVSGTFDSFDIVGVVQSESIFEMMEHAELIINTESINSNSEFRDQNILNYFFSQTPNRNQISGKVVSIDGTETEGRLEVLLDFNNKQDVLFFDYTFLSNEIRLQAIWNAEDWNAGKAIDNMEICCKMFHTGTDGVHLVWPDVKIEIVASLDFIFK